MSRSLLTTLLSDAHTVANYQGGVGVTGSTNCSDWANQIGAAGALIQATGTKQPTISGTSLIFDGTSDSMTASLTVSQPCTVYMVLKQLAWTNQARIFDTNSSMLLTQDAVSPKIDIYAGLGFVSLNGDLSLNTLGVIQATYSGASSGIKVNHKTSTVGNPGGNGSGGTFVLGSIKTANGSYSNIEVKEIIVRNQVDSLSTQSNIRNYLAAIHSLDIGIEPNIIAIGNQQHKRRRG